MKQMMAYCGLNCETCQARLATVRQDESLRRAVAEQWSKLNGVEITPEMICCVGCRVEGSKTLYCESLCPIRQCALSRKVETCGSCEEMDTCRKLGAILRNNPDARRNLRGWIYTDLRDRQELMDRAAVWFHEKWGVPMEAYRGRMQAYLSDKTEYGWYLCLDGDRIVGGLGVIENDFHDRKDLKPNVCAVYTEEAYRGQGIAGQLLDLAVRTMKAKGISPLYLVTDHVGFYERYGWKFLCMARDESENKETRVYVHP